MFSRGKAVMRQPLKQVPLLIHSSSIFQTKREKEAAKNDVRKVRGPDGQPIYFTKENVTKLYGAFEASKIEVFEQLQKTFTPEQVSAYFSVQGLSSLTVLKL